MLPLCSVTSRLWVSELPIHIMFTSSFCHGVIQRLASSQMCWPTTVITRTKMTVRLTANPSLLNPPSYDQWPAWVNYNLPSAAVPQLKARRWKLNRWVYSLRKLFYRANTGWCPWSQGYLYCLNPVFSGNSGRGRDVCRAVPGVGTWDVRNIPRDKVWSLPPIMWSKHSELIQSFQ